MFKAGNGTTQRDGSSNHEPVVVSYFFVSIMSHLFHKQEAIRQITSYANIKQNTVYIYGTRLYEATREALFGDEWTVDPIEKELNKCRSLLDQYTEENNKVDWRVFYTIPQYQIFRKFTDAITDPKLSLETLQNAFPGIEDELLNRLLASAAEAQLSTHMSNIASSFAEKNMNKLKKQVSKAMRNQKQLVKLNNKNCKKAPIQELNSEEPSVDLQAREKLLNTQLEILKLGTYTLLSDEFSAFMTLNALRDPKDIRKYFGVSYDFNHAPEVMPEAWYPIKATLNAEEIFDTHTLVARLYQQYAASLNLPETPEGGAVKNIPNINCTDSDISETNSDTSEELSSHRKNHAPQSAAVEVDADFSNEAAPAMKDNKKKYSKAPAPHRLPASIDPGFTYSRPIEGAVIYGNTTTLYSAAISHQDLIVIVDDIIRDIEFAIDEPNPLVEGQGSVIQNRMKCMLKFENLPKAAHEKASCEEKEFLKKIIAKTIQQTTHDFARNAECKYRGLHFTLYISLITPKNSPNRSRDSSPPLQLSGSPPRY